MEASNPKSRKRPAKKGGESMWANCKTIFREEKGNGKRSIVGGTWKLFGRGENERRGGGTLEKKKKKRPERISCWTLQMGVGGIILKKRPWRIQENRRHESAFCGASRHFDCEIYAQGPGGTARLKTPGKREKRSPVWRKRGRTGKESTKGGGSVYC